MKRVAFAGSLALLLAFSMPAAAQAPFFQPIEPLPGGSGTRAEAISADETIIVNGLMFARPGLPVTPMTAEQIEQMQSQMAEQGAR